MAFQYSTWAFEDAAGVAGCVLMVHLRTRRQRASAMQANRTHQHHRQQPPAPHGINCSEGILRGTLRHWSFQLVTELDANVTISWKCGAEVDTHGQLLARVARRLPSRASAGLAMYAQSRRTTGPTSIVWPSVHLETAILHAGATGIPGTI